MEQERKRILIIYTGGTIGMMKTRHGYAPQKEKFHQLLDAIPELKAEGMPEWEVVDMDPLLDSSNITVKEWNTIGTMIAGNYDRFDGFVILHGTDTMAYTAAALSYLIQDCEKPIVLTGSQKPIDMEITDAKTNLLDSFIYAASDNATGVVIVFNGKVILGTRARKVRTKSFDAFESINFPVLARIRDGRLFEYIFFPKKETLFCDRISTRVGLIKLVPGLDAEVISFYFNRYDAISLESYGVGGIPSGEYYKLHSEIKKWTDKNKILIMTTQVPNEGSNMEVYKVGYGSKKEYNMLESYDMTLESCYAKMAWILGRTNDPAEIHKLFYKTVSKDILYGELRREEKEHD